MQNRAAVMPELGRIEIRDVGYPEVTGRDVIVRIEAVGVCGSDTAYFTVGYIGDWVVDGPIILGHEVAGQVHAVGAGRHAGAGRRPGRDRAGHAVPRLP